MWLVGHAGQTDVGPFLAPSAQDEDSPPDQLEAFSAAAADAVVRVRTLVRPAGGQNFQTRIGMYPDALGG